MTHRTLSVLSAILLPFALAAQQDAKPSVPKVVFVCEHGAAKSVIAAEEFNRLRDSAQIDNYLAGTSQSPKRAGAPGHGKDNNSAAMSKNPLPPVGFRQ